MERIQPSKRSSRHTARLAVYTILITIPFAFAHATTAQAVTKSFGEPYRGHLVNGIPFPRQFSGYILRNPDHTYTTPELIGALLDAIEGVERRYPNTCPLYIGDFSKPGGGRFRGHRSHQNGRDVDIGMYAKGNVPLDGFEVMNRRNLDVAKTWCLIENLLKSDRVQYIFMDRRLQAIFFKYALAHGWSRSSLDLLFKNIGKAYEHAIICHVRGHINHLHVRFYAPWSALAAATTDPKKLATISMAQEAYLPTKVRYYVKDGEPSLRMLARSFGVSYEDLCRWNEIRASDRPGIGSCLVYYKRGFQLEPVNLAQSLAAPTRISSGLVRLASLAPQNLVNDSSPDYEQQHQSRKEYIYYQVKRGDSLYGIARTRRISVNELCQLNAITRKTKLQIGTKLKVGVVTTKTAALPERPRTTTYTVAKGDTLSEIAEQYHMTIRQLSAINDVSRDDVLRPGQELKVGRTAKAKPVPSPIIYTVKSGDSLWSIASAYQTSIAALCEANGLSRNTVLKLGRKLKIPGSGTNPAHAASAIAFYTIKPGDNLWAISRKYKTSVESICSANNFTAKTVLRPGAKIKIP